MSKKTNTVWFMVLATLLNLVLMIVLFVICFVIIAKVDPEGTKVQILIPVAFLVSIAGSFFLYSVIIKKLSAKMDLEHKLAPLFNRRPKKKPEEQA